VSPRLFLGNFEAAENLPAKITHVVTVDPSLPRSENEEVSFLRIPILDDNKDDLLPWISRAVDFIRLASDDTVEFPLEKEEGYRVTVRLQRESTAIKWGITWHQGLFQARKYLVVDDIVEDTLMHAWNAERAYDGWQLRYGDKLLFVNGADANTKAGRTELQTATTVMLTFWRNRELPPGCVLVHCHAGVSRSVAVVLAYWMHHARIPPKTALRRLRRVLPDCEPNPHLLEELDQFWAMGCCVEEGSTDAHKQYHLRQAQKAWESKNTVTSSAPVVPATSSFVGAVSRDSVKEQQGDDVSRKDTTGKNEDYINNAQQSASGMLSSNASTTTGGQPEHRKLDDINGLIQDDKDINGLIKDDNDALKDEGVDDTVTESSETAVVDGSSVTINYCCRKCRFSLFSHQEVLAHEGQSPSCTSIFAQPMNWMGELTDQSGRLICPCGAKLGAYCWFGLACSCKAWQAPGFQIHRARIDEMRS